MQGVKNYVIQFHYPPTRREYICSRQLIKPLSVTIPTPHPKPSTSTRLLTYQTAISYHPPQTQYYHQAVNLSPVINEQPPAATHRSLGSGDDRGFLGNLPHSDDFGERCTRRCCGDRSRGLRQRFPLSQSFVLHSQSLSLELCLELCLDLCWGAGSGGGGGSGGLGGSLLLSL